MHHSEVNAVVEAPIPQYVLRDGEYLSIPIFTFSRNNYIYVDVFEPEILAARIENLVLQDGANLARMVTSARNGSECNKLPPKRKKEN